MQAQRPGGGSPDGGASGQAGASGQPGASGSPEHRFTAELWVWDARSEATWTFVTVPVAISESLADEAEAKGPRAGFGSIRVEVRAGPVTWRTSVFPDSASGCFVLPVKKAVRAANNVGAGDRVTVALRSL